MLFSDPVRAGLTYVGASCSTADGASVCGDVSYDPDSRVVSSTIATLADRGTPVVLTVEATAGTIPATYRNRASAGPGSGTDAFTDPVPASNTSAVSVQVFNTAAPVVVTTSLTGLPAGGLAEDLTLSGEITCAEQGAKPWSVTIPAGSSSATGRGVLFYTGDSCTVSQDDAAPAGYFATGTLITPSTIEAIPASGTVAVSSTTRLARLGTLTMDSSATPTTALPGDTVRYDLTVANTGASDAAQVSATAALPADLTFVSASNGGVDTGGTVTWAGVDLVVGATEVLSVDVTVDPGTLGAATVAFGVQPPDHVMVTVDHACTDDAARTCATSTVHAVDQPPVAVDDPTVHVANGSDTRLDVLANDTDPEDDTLTITTATADHGTVDVVEDGAALEYHADETYRGPVVVGYAISDGHGGTDTADAHVEVDNAPPVVTWSLPVEVRGDLLSAVDLLGHTSDANGDTVTVTAVGAPHHGAAVLRSDGSVLYTPDPGYAGDDSFTFTIDDGHDGTATGTALLHVDAELRAHDDRARTDQGMAVTVQVLRNDGAGERAALDPGTLRLIKPAGGEPTVRLDVPAVGTWTAADGAITFTPEPTFTGNATVAYRISEVVEPRAPALAALALRPAPLVDLEDPLTVSANLTVTVRAAADPGQPQPKPKPSQPAQPGPTQEHADGSGPGDTLAQTGGPAADDLALGLVLLLSGWALVLAGRRRRRRA